MTRVLTDRSKAKAIPPWILLCAGLALLTTGCVTTNQPSLTTSKEPKAITFAVDARDYREIGKVLAESLLSDENLALNDNIVLALGPVEDDTCLYRFDARKLQEKLQTILFRAGKAQVSFAVDAMKENSAAVARYNVMRLQWEKESTVDPEDLRTFGALADIDYLLFGRIASQVSTKGRAKEVTYTFNWKLGDCRSGLLVWTYEEERAKSGLGPVLPEWVTDPRSDSARYLYTLGSAQRSGTRQEALESAKHDAESAFAERLNAQFGSGGGFVQPVSARQLDAEQAPQGQHVIRSGFHYSAWRLMRFPRERYEREIAKRKTALDTWRRAETAFTQATDASDPAEKALLSRRALALLERIVDEYPIGAQTYVLSERALLRIAAIWMWFDNPWEARRCCRQILEHSASQRFRKTAATRLEEMPVTAEFRSRAALMRIFFGRTVRLACAYSLDGTLSRWRSMEEKLASHLRRAHAVVLDPPDLTLQEMQNVASGERNVANADSDIVVAASYKGKAVTRPNPDALSGHDARLEGNAFLRGMADGNPIFSCSLSGVKNGWSSGGKTERITDMASKLFANKFHSVMLKATTSEGHKD